MKSLQFFFLAFAVACAAPASAKLDLNRASVSHLPNGLTVIMLEDHSFPVVSVQVLYKSGSAAEVTGKTGLAHFLEHLAFRGSANFPRGRATELIYDAGGEWHGYTAMDQTTYFATMPRDGLELLLRIEADRMARTVIDPGSITAEKGAVITELHSYENDPMSVLQDAVARTAIQSHPYGSPMAGYVSDVEQLTIEDARFYYASHYAPGNAVFAIAGDFDPAQAKALVERSFADVPGRAVAAPHFTAELPQRGERRTRLTGPVDRQYFQIAFPSPAASSGDFPAFLLVQQLLSGTPGLNPRQSGWSASPVSEGSLLAGVTEDIGAWLPTTHDPFLYTLSGTIAARADRATVERQIQSKIAALRDRPISATQLQQAKAQLAKTLSEDILTTEDAAHQLAYFEGIGALDVLLGLPASIAKVSAEDVRRVARTYLAPEKRTVAWMVPGPRHEATLGAANPKPAEDRQGSHSPTPQAAAPQMRRLSAGLPAVVQYSPLSDTVSVELLLSAPAKNGSRPGDLPGLGVVLRSGDPAALRKLVPQTLAALHEGPASTTEPSSDPETRLQQIIEAQMITGAAVAPQPIAVVVAGNVDPSKTFAMLEKELGTTPAASVPADHAAPRRQDVREKIAKPLAQGGLGYVVQGPAPGTREALAWRMLLYVLTHDYSGRLGRSAITEKGLVYHIYSALRTDGRRTWATISTGVDPDKADAMEAELKAQLARLISGPPAPAEVDAARSHLIGRDVSAAQSNDELADKLIRNFVATGGLMSHEQMRATLESITPADLSAAARSFTKGAIIRVDVEKAQR
jgi:zinc protease